MSHTVKFKLYYTRDSPRFTDGTFDYLIFLICVNDLNKASIILNPIMFADDTNLFYSHCYINYFQTLNQELTHITEWLKANKRS